MLSFELNHAKRVISASLREKKRLATENTGGTEGEEHRLEAYDTEGEKKDEG